MNTFDDIWLSRYPIPEYIGFDNGGKYKNVFEELVDNYGIKKKNSTPFNPQSNGIIERVHLTLLVLFARQRCCRCCWRSFVSNTL
jgi:transposase InsO family protein